MTMNHLWQNEHPYHGPDGNYHLAADEDDTLRLFDSWAEFLEAWGDADPDYNLAYRWDWGPEGEPFPLSIHYMMQRKGFHVCCRVDVGPEDEGAVRLFLDRKWSYLWKLWQGVSNVPYHSKGAMV